MGSLGGSCLMRWPYGMICPNRHALTFVKSLLVCFSWTDSFICLFSNVWFESSIPRTLNERNRSTCMVLEASNLAMDWAVKGIYLSLNPHESIEKMAARNGLDHTLGHIRESASSRLLQLQLPEPSPHENRRRKHVVTSRLYYPLGNVLSQGKCPGGVMGSSLLLAWNMIQNHSFGGEFMFVIKLHSLFADMCLYCGVVAWHVVWYSTSKVRHLPRKAVKCWCDASIFRWMSLSNPRISSSTWSNVRRTSNSGPVWVRPCVFWRWPGSPNTLKRKVLDHHG